MSSRKERLEKAKKDSFLVGLAVGARLPSQVPKAIENLRAIGIEFTNEDEKIAKVVAQLKRDDPKSFKAIFGKMLERKESKMDKKEVLNREQALEKIRELRKKFGIKDEELLPAATNEKPIEPKIQERKKEAENKKIVEKALVIAWELGHTRRIYTHGYHMGGLYKFFSRFTNRDFKIRSYCSHSKSLLYDDPARIYAKQKGKVFKELVFMYELCYSRIKVYKPGPWEGALDSLYEKALAHKRKKEEEGERARKQKLAENFDL